MNGASFPIGVKYKTLKHSVRIICFIGLIYTDCDVVQS